MDILQNTIVDKTLQQFGTNFDLNIIQKLNKSFESLHIGQYTDYEILYGYLLRNAWNTFQEIPVYDYPIDIITDFCNTIDRVLADYQIGASSTKRNRVWNLIFQLSMHFSTEDQELLIQEIRPADQQIFIYTDNQIQAVARQEFISTVFNVLATTCRHPVQNRLAIARYVQSMCENLQ